MAGRNMIDELEPGPSNAVSKAESRVRELREVADMIEACPEIAGLDDWYDAALRMLMDLDALDIVDPGDL